MEAKKFIHLIEDCIFGPKSENDKFLMGLIVGSNPEKVYTDIDELWNEIKTWENAHAKEFTKKSKEDMKRDWKDEMEKY